MPKKWQAIAWMKGGPSHHVHIDGLVQERRNSIADALELRLSYTNPSTYAPPDLSVLTH